MPAAYVQSLQSQRDLPKWLLGRTAVCDGLFWAAVSALGRKMKNWEKVGNTGFFFFIHHGFVERWLIGNLLPFQFCSICT